MAFWLPTTIALVLIGAMWQFSTRRYQAFAYWFFAYALPDANSVAANVVPGRLTVTVCLILLVGVILASVCGAAVYKEPATP